jgi:replicative DNA helicase
MKHESYNFTDDFQDEIIACLIRHSDELAGYGRFIRHEYFNGESAIETFKAIEEYLQKYGHYPGFTVLANYVFKKLERKSDEQAKEVLDYVQKIAEINTKDWEGVRDQCVNFAQERAIFDAIRRIGLSQKDNKKIDAVSMMKQAVQVGTNINDLGLSLYHDYAKVIDQVTSSTYGVSTGYSHLDALWKTGWGPGWVIMVLAPPKRYKTTFCINLALNMATSRAGCDVLYFACEIPQEMAMLKSMYNICEIREQDIFRNPQKAKQEVGKMLKKKMHSHLFFKSFPSKSATISDLHRYARLIRDSKGLKPKAIVIDYAETVLPNEVKKDTPDWRMGADVYYQAEAMGRDLGCCIIMPDRCNKDAVNRKVPSATSVQGSYQKNGAVHIALGLCQTEAEYLQNKIRYFVFLNRYGEAFKHYEGRVHPELSKMTIDKEIDYKPDDGEEDDGGLGRPKGRGGRPRGGLPGSERTQRD